MLRQSLIAMAVSSVLLTACVAAQDSGGKTSNAANATQPVVKQHARGGLSELNLSPTQKKQMAPIFDEQREQVLAVRKDTSITPQERKARLDRIHQQTETKVEALLTPEQKKKWQQIKADRKKAAQESEAQPHP